MSENGHKGEKGFAGVSLAGSIVWTYDNFYAYYLNGKFVPAAHYLRHNILYRMKEIKEKHCE